MTDRPELREQLARTIRDNCPFLMTEYAYAAADAVLREFVIELRPVDEPEAVA